MNKTLKRDILNSKIALGISDSTDINNIEKLFDVKISKESKMFFYFDGKPIALSTYFNGYGIHIEDASILRGW